MNIFALSAGGNEAFKDIALATAHLFPYVAVISYFIGTL